MEQFGDGDGGGDRRSGSRGRGREQWETGYNNPAPLRRPYGTVNQQTASANQTNEVSNDVVKNSELSAEAAEFVPRNFVVQGNQQNHGYTARHSVQNRLTTARNPSQSSHHAPPQYHYGNQQYSHQLQHMQYQQYVDSDQPTQGYHRYDGGYNNFGRNQQENRNIENNRSEPSLNNVLSHVNTAMETLSRSPDQFDNLIVSLVGNITPHLKIETNTQAIVSAIILKCISEANFRYSGARLCSHLDLVENPPSDETPTIFRAALYERCRSEKISLSTDWPQIIDHTPQDERKCHGLILSLAELVAQMDTRPALILGKLLIEVISIALENPGPNTVKYICQSLKLSGQYLERDSATNRQEIECVMHELGELVMKGRVDASVGRMVISVRELRSSNWGRTVSPIGPTPVDINETVNQQLQQQQFDEPVLYGPDGTVLSAEERQFCQDLANLDEGPDESWQPGMSSGDLEEDEDEIIAAAYEEFLKLPPNNNTGGVKRA